jgi:phosphoribosylanthranilate isomerase
MAQILRSAGLDVTFIKFCGLTRAEDVAIAVELNVDAVGFVFWSDSPRAIALKTATRLISALPVSVAPVGVFVCPTREEIARAVGATGIRVAQVHGMNDMSVLSGVPCDLWVATSLFEVRSVVGANGATVLLDTHDPLRHGGTGKTIDWDAAGAIAADRRVMLAGGLTPDNVGEAIRRVKPYGVDVSSGIEDQPGIKNEQLMRAFARAVRDLDSL